MPLDTLQESSLQAQDITVVVLNDYCHINGGASRVAIDEAVSLADGGVEVIFLGASGPVCNALKHSAIRVVCLEQPELLEAKANPSVVLQGLWNIAAYRKMQEILHTCNPARTIVHLHGYTKALTSSPVRCATQQGFGVVCTLHDFFTACPNGAFFNYVERRPCPLTGLSASCITTNCDKRHYAHKLYRVARNAIQRGPGRLPSGVRDYITLSRRSAQILRPYLPATARYHSLENLIEVPQEPPVNIAANDNVVFVGRLDTEKGIEVLLEAVRRSGVKLTLVGEGPLRAMAEAVARCTVTGWISPTEVIAHLGKARCLVFPSLWYEAYGLVVAEAAARGIPAIVSDISAASERVEDGLTGWIVRAGDADDLTRCLTLTSDTQKLQAMGQAAYTRFWSAPPTRANHTEGLLQIYGNILLNRDGKFT